MKTARSMVSSSLYNFIHACLVQGNVQSSEVDALKAMIVQLQQENTTIREEKNLLEFKNSLLVDMVSLILRGSLMLISSLYKIWTLSKTENESKHSNVHYRNISSQSLRLNECN